MNTLFMLIWTMAATVLAGSFIVVALIMPQIGTMLHLSEPLVILAAAVLGAVVAVPLASSVSKALQGPTKS